MPLPGHGFTFKQFFVAHDRCAMKVNTDAIILGAWSNVGSARRILDIGTGSGIVALMMAQKSSSTVFVDGIELELQAYLQAKENFANSLWRDKIQAIHKDIMDYSCEVNRRYDLIVTNPPYFVKGVDCYSNARNQARYTSTLTHENLLLSCERLLTPEGRLSLVLPYNIATKFLTQAECQGWYCGRKLTVTDSKLKPPHLLLLEIAPYPLTCCEDFLMIRNVDRKYSDEFRKLTGDFYLFF